MLFAILQSRLLAVLARRIRNGELTERGLALRLGASQPHIHNVLKGVRVLSTRLADHIICELDIRIEQLLTPEEIERVRCRRP
ncbi:MAG: XRE family transcriptional regulator [Acidobacteria bacterium]|nr:XRE family transcriptional regulator [Acidobacteriota bacterium]